MPEDNPDKLIEAIKRRGLCSEKKLEDAVEALRVARSLGVRARLEEILVEKKCVDAATMEEILRSVGSTRSRPAIAGYEIIDRIGKGGMGAVYRARQKILNRTVALKILSPSLAADRVFIQRFQREARLAARMNHPNLVQVYSVGRDGDRYYMAMEYVHGPSVADLVERQGRIPDEQAAWIGIGVARALEAVAEQGVVHRDIKPSNILLAPSGKPKVTDLGLAKSSEESLALTRPGSAVGTPNYMSPEQARGEPVLDIRSDIYSLGATLYHMVAGRVPFSAPTHFETLRMHVDARLPAPETVRPEVSSEMSAVIRRMMEKNPSARYQSAAEVAEALEQVRRKAAARLGEDHAARGGSKPQKSGRAASIRRRFGLWLVWAAATGAMIGAALAVAERRRTPRVPAVPPVSTEARLTRRPVSQLPLRLRERVRFEAVGAWGGQGEGEGSFREPSAVAVSPDGTVYVADRWNHRVQFFDPDGKRLGQWGGEGRSADRFFAPGGLNADTSGVVRVADTGRGKTLFFSTRGTFLRSLGRPGADRGEFARPVGVDVDASGRVFVLEELNSRVQVFGPDGTWLRTIDRDADGRSLFDRPRGIAVASEERFYVADPGLGAVVRVDLASNGIRAKAIDLGEGAAPAGICLDDRGRAYVSDMRNHRICVIEGDALYAALGRAGRGEGDLSRPEGLAWSPDGALWIADTGNDRIQKWRLEFHEAQTSEAGPREVFTPSP